MDTQSNINFYVIVYYYENRLKKEKKVHFAESIEVLLADADKYTLKIIENTNYDLKFQSNDTQAKLYIEGIEDIESSHFDAESNEYYIMPSEDTIHWFKWDITEKGLVPGTYYIKVLYKQEVSYAILNISPKHMDINKLEQMKKEAKKFLLEEDKLTIGLKETIKSKYNHSNENNAKKQIKLLMQWHLRIVSLLNELKTTPYEKIEKIYTYTNKQISKKSDKNSIKMALNKNLDPNKTFSYTKNISYETKENKWVKSFNERLLKLTMSLVKNELEDDELKVIKNIENTCMRLRTTLWYADIECSLNEELPIRSRYDSKYRVLLELDNALYRNSNLDLIKDKDLIWLETSWIYEIWCFQKIYHSLIDLQKYKVVNKTRQSFILSKSDITLKLYYDAGIPMHVNETSIGDMPLYARSPLHRRPDGRIDLYQNEKYLGTVILEFKYSTQYYVWNKNRKTRCSEQLLHYGYQLASPYLNNLYNLPINIMNSINPIYKVIAIMPELSEDNDIFEDDETNIAMSKLCVGEDHRALIDYIEKEVQIALSRH